LRLAMAAVVVASMGLAGCSASSVPGSGPKMESAQSAKLKNISTKRLGEGAILGAVLGGLVGGTLVALNGGNGGQIAQGAAVGGIVGAGGGMIFAASVNKSAEQQANEQQRYRAILDNADTNIAIYKRAASTAAEVAASENRRIPLLNAELQAGKISAAQYRKEIADAKDNVNSLNRLIQDASVDINDMNTMIGTTGPDPLKERRTALIEQKAALEKQRDALLDSYSRVTPEAGLRL